MQSDTEKLLAPASQDDHWSGQPGYSDHPPPYYPAEPRPPPGPSGYPPHPPYPPYYQPAPAPPAPPPVVCQPTNVVVVNTQPAVTYLVRPKDYLCWSILNCLCCFWPLGLIAIICSCKTQSAADRNDMAEAASSSRAALWLNVSSLVVGLVVLLVFCIVYLPNMLHH